MRREPGIWTIGEIAPEGMVVRENLYEPRRIFEENLGGRNHSAYPEFSIQRNPPAQHFRRPREPNTATERHNNFGMVKAEFI